MKRLLPIICVCAVVLGLAGCTTRTYSLGRLTLVSTQNIRDLQYEVGANSETAAIVEGESCLTVKPGFIVPNASGDATGRINKAIDSAIANGRKKGIDGDVIVNAQIDYRVENSTSGTDRYCTTVKGLLVKLREYK